MFSTRTCVDFSADVAKGRTVMELEASDRPGLLSDVGRVFAEQGVDITAAKIMTIGERAEDVFYISDESGAPLSEDAQSELKDRLIERIDAARAQAAS